MTWVKVCGITTTEARDAAVEAGADALGFVLIDSSPRALTPGRAATLIGGAPIPCFVLVAASDPRDAIATALACGASGIQPYGDSADAIGRAGLAEGLVVLRPVPVLGDGLPNEARTVDPGFTVLFDAADGGGLGGTGATFHWEAVAGWDRPFVLAGGLGPDNVADAIATTGAWGVDASSRLESEPGVKDPDTIRAFVREAKHA